MTANELKECVEKHPKNQSQIADDIGITRATIGRWIKGERNISEPDSKLLRLYFYNEVPFQGLHPGPDLGNILSFSPEEWRIMEILARRQGMVDTKAWIISQIRAYLDHNSQAQEARKELQNSAPGSQKQSPPQAG
jgi:transcriptional regulator with XRE-family HTH domain